jgi:hypothetical protein
MCLQKKKKEQDERKRRGEEEDVVVIFVGVTANRDRTPGWDEDRRTRSVDYDSRNNAKTRPDAMEVRGRGDENSLP